MTIDAKAFTAFERMAHDRIAKTYTEHFAPLTSLAVEALLDAAQVAPGRRLLDVATGPGVAAAAAHARGATATGVDVSPGMIALAETTHPTITFRVAEVTALPFPDAAFDTVVCNFALGHFPEPEAAVVECVRVLEPGGTLAFTWWDQPQLQRVQGLFREVIAELGLQPPRDVPRGHDTLRYSDAGAFASLLSDAGLEGTAVAAHGTTHLMPDVEALWRAGMGGMAVTASAVAAQDAATQARAREALARRAEVYRSTRGLEIPIAFLVGTGKKPDGHQVL
jgi:SAM-dependent methyltransferase